MFNAGDRVRVVKGPYKKYIGVEATVSETAVTGYYVIADESHQKRLGGSKGVWWFNEAWTLELIYDPSEAIPEDWS